MSGNSYLDRKLREPRLKGRAAERKTAKRHAADLVPASGAANAKGDFANAAFLFEHKATIKDSLSLKLEWLTKISDEARASLKKPALALTFITAADSPRPKGAWVMVREEDFKILCQLAGEAR